MLRQKPTQTLPQNLLNPHMHKMGPWGPNLATTFAKKIPENSGSMYSSILMVGNI